MSAVWVPLKDIPAQGREFSFADQEAWSERWEEFRVNMRVKDSLAADVSVLPQADGVLVTGHIHGTAETPCDRCAEYAEVALDHRFDEFEPFVDATEPAKDTEAPDGAEDGMESYLRRTKNGYEINVEGIIWEQFVLALPDHPLCGEACRGLCTACGQNLNQAECDCETEELDPRMAVLRGLKVERKQ